MLRTTLPVCVFLMTCLTSHSLSGQIIFDNGVGGAKGIDTGFISDQKPESYATDNFDLLGAEGVRESPGRCLFQQLLKSTLGWSKSRAVATSRP